MKTIKLTLLTLLIFIIVLADFAMGLTPLWVWIANGHSINGGINDTPLSFGLGFIGTFFFLSSSISISTNE